MADSTRAPGGISVEDYLAVATPLIVITGVLVIIRCVVNLAQLRKLFISDCLAIVAVAMIAATSAVNYITISDFQDDPPAPYLLLQMAETINVLGSLMLWTSKAPLLVLYIEIFGVKTWMRISSYATLAISGAIIIAIMGYAGKACNPNQAEVSFESAEVCTHSSVISSIIAGCTTLSTDVIAFCLPIIPVWQLHLPIIKRLCLALVFFSGILSIAASSVALHYKLRAFTAVQEEMNIAMLCEVIECTTAVMVGCAPAMKAFWSSYLVKVGIFSKIRSSLASFSQPTTTGTSKNFASTVSSEQLHKRGQTEPWAPDEGQYIRMQTPRKSDSSNAV